MRSTLPNACDTSRLPGRPRTPVAPRRRMAQVAARDRPHRPHAARTRGVGGARGGADRGDRAGGGLPQPARDRQPHRLPAQAAAAGLLGRRRAARRVRRGAAQLHADRADPEGDEGRGPGDRGRALLQAQRRRLQGRAARRPGQLRRGTSQGASTITMQVARNFYLSTEKTFTRKIYEMLLTFKIETPAHQGPDPRDLHEPDLPRATAPTASPRRARSTSASR